MTPVPTCSCPSEPPVDYGRGWTLTDDGWVCSRCNGVMREDQERATITAFEEAGCVPPPMKPTPSELEAYRQSGRDHLERLWGTLRKKQP